MTRTKSKLGTDKKVKSISRRKPKKGQISTTSTTLRVDDYNGKSLADWQREWDKITNPNPKLPLHWQFLLWTGIIILIIWLIRTLIR